jgi:hypothetical protein
MVFILPIEFWTPSKYEQEEYDEEELGEVGLPFYGIKGSLGGIQGEL